MLRFFRVIILASVAVSQQQTLVGATVQEITSSVTPAAGTDVEGRARPNILLLFPDQWRSDWAGFAYAHTNTSNTKVPLLLPTLAKYAANGVRFTQAYVPAPVCAPSRSCFASGRQYDRAGVLDNFDNDYPINQTTFYTILRDVGYHTMTVGKDDLTKATQLGKSVNYRGCSYCREGDGLYHQRELGFSDALRYSGKEDVVNEKTPHEMYGFFLRNKTVRLEHGGTTTGWMAHRACFGREDKRLCDALSFPQQLYEDDFTANNAVALLRRRPRDKPFFLQVSFPGPHSPFLVTAPMADEVASRDWPNATDNAAHPEGGRCPATHEPSNGGSGRRCDYAAEIEHLDGLFEKVLAEVKAQGVLGQTLVCFSSDHGEMLGDHGDHGKTLPWQGSAAVPLVCVGPGVREGVVVTQPVATLDLVGTFLDYAGASPDPGMTVRSLRPLLEKGLGTAADYPVSSGLHNWRMVVHRRLEDGKSYKIICCNGPCPKAPSTLPPQTGGYNLLVICVEDDPFDMADLSSTPLGSALAKKLAPLLPAPYAEGCKLAAQETRESVPIFL